MVYIKKVLEHIVVSLAQDKINECLIMTKQSIVCPLYCKMMSNICNCLVFND